MKKGLLWIAVLFLLLSACAAPLSPETAEEIPIPAVTEDNPYVGLLETHDNWQYHVYEAFRGAGHERFEERLAYSEVYASEDGSETKISLSTPYLSGGGDFVHTVNAYYREKCDRLLAGLPTLRAEWADMSHFAEYREEALYAYTWRQFYIVITEHHTCTSRNDCVPLVDHFDTGTGRRLALSDLFCVGEEEYLPALTECARAAGARQLTPPFGTWDSISLPAAENFMVTPNGLMLLYPPGQLSAVAEGPVMLAIPYRDLITLLDPALFGGMWMDGGGALRLLDDTAENRSAFRELLPLDRYETEGDGYLLWCEEPLTDLAFAAVCPAEETGYLEQWRVAAYPALTLGAALALTVSEFDISGDGNGGYKFSYTRADGTYEECILAPDAGGAMRLALLVPSAPEPAAGRPWGVDDDAYALWQSGALDPCIPKGDALFHAVCGDLNGDGISDVLMLTQSAVQKTAFYSSVLRTLVLLGDGEGGFSLAARDDGIAYLSARGDATALHAGDGWFKLEHSTGKYGGMEMCTLYEYNGAEWVLTERYDNSYGYFEYGISSILTPVHFGRVVFGAGPVWDEDFWAGRDYAFKRGAVDISGSYPVLTLADKDKEAAVNALIADGYFRIADYLKTRDADVNLSVHILLQTPRVLCVEYQIFGTVDGVELMGDDTRYATLLVDMETARRLTLADLLGAEDWQARACDVGNWSAAWRETPFTTLPEGFDRLPEDCDDFDAMLRPGGAGFFCAIYERSLAVYWQPDFWNATGDGRKGYLIKDLLEPAMRWNPWAYESRAAEHIEWKG